MGLCALLIAAAVAGAQEYRWELPKGFPQPRVPVDNSMSEAKAQLGRHLFYDRRLSVNGRQSCASCHKQELAFTDGRATALGTTGTAHPRSAMSLVNVAYSAALTWSNPTLRSLEQQALVPMLGEHPVELGMRGREDAVLSELRSDPVYRDLFPKAFPTEPLARGKPATERKLNLRPPVPRGSAAENVSGEQSPFTVTNVVKAIATFERTIISARSPYDRYYTGGERDAISEAAKRGEVLFFTDPIAGCFRCHGGFYFSDSTAAQFHNTALYLSDRRKFKAPTLRNIALTAPYMHDGSIATLEEVLDHYAAGGRAHGNPGRDARMRPIALTARNREDLLAFLRSLTDSEVVRDPRLSNPW